MLIWMISTAVMKTIFQEEKKLTVFDDIFTDMVSNKKLRVLVIELFSGNICLFTIFLVFITQS